MKKHISFIAAAAVAAACLAPAAYAEESPELVVLGDSIASGYGLDGYTAGDNYSAEDSFANRLGADFGGYSNFARDGRTSGELLTALSDEDISAALSTADTVVISIGGNDFLQPMMSAVQNAVMSDPDLLTALQSGTVPDLTDDDQMQLMMKLMETMIDAADAVDTAATGDNISGILSGISELNSDCRIMILTVYDPFENVPGMEMLDVTAREKLAGLNAEISGAAGEYGAEVVDVHSAFAGHAAEYTNITAMDIHPNKSGHGVIYSLLSDLTAAQTSAPSDAETEASGGAGEDGGSAPAKGSPETGAGSAALAVGAVLIAGGAMFAARKK